MDTLKIKTFLLVEKYKSFSKTAEEFSYTPSAISHIADSLEEELGVKLFKRTSHGVEITEAGKALHDKFSAVIEAEERLFEAADGLCKKQETVLKIGTYSSIALYILPEVLQGFKKEYPNVSTSILIDDNMNGWIENGVADVVLSDELVDTKYWHPLTKDEYVAVVPKSDFADKSEISAEELYQYPFIQSNEKQLDTYLDYSKFKDIIPVKSIEYNSAIYMVKEKLGITILPRICTKSLPQGVKKLKLNPKISRMIGIAYDTKHPSWICKHFVQHINSTLNNLTKNKF